MEGNENNDRGEIFSKAVRAGKRTYFFDVKATRGNDYYLTVTESKKRFLEDGKFRYEKHKLFLYKEDFDKFSEGLSEAISKISELNGADNNGQENQEPGGYTSVNTDSAPEIKPEKDFTSVSFEDLER